MEQETCICCDYIGELGVAPSGGCLSGWTQEIMNEANQTGSPAPCALLLTLTICPTSERAALTKLCLYNDPPALHTTNHRSPFPHHTAFCSIEGQRRRRSVPVSPPSPLTRKPTMIQNHRPYSLLSRTSTDPLRVFPRQPRG